MRGGDTTRAGSVLLSVTALGRAERVPGRAGARPGDALVVTGPLGAAGAAFRAGRLARPPLRVEEGRGSRGWRPRCSTSPTGSRPTPRTSRAARAAARRSSSSACRSPTARLLEDVGFGEDYELLAATPDPLGFTVIGRCEEGSGVGLTLHGEPVELAGWEHFR